jgi:THO complex subunit 4
MYPGAAAGGGSGGRVSAIETGTKLYISNLDFGVSNDDIKVYASPARIVSCF